MTPISYLSELGACGDLVKWASAYPDLEAAWLQCDRGDWLLWYAGALSGPPESEGRKKLVLAACACARLALPIFEARNPGEDSPRKCIEMAERWAAGAPSVTIQMVREAAASANAVYADAASSATAVYAYAASYAASSAADAIYADADTADVFSAAAYSASSAATAIYADADTADVFSAAAYAAFSVTSVTYAAIDKTDTLKRCAEIVRQYYPALPAAS